MSQKIGIQLLKAISTFGGKLEEITLGAKKSGEWTLTFSNEFYLIQNERNLEGAIKDLKAKYQENGYLEIEYRTAKSRTQKQNRSLHVWCRQTAEILRNSGVDTKQFFKEGYEVPFTTEIVTDKDSSRELTTSEVTAVYEQINLLLAEKGIHVPWPCRG